jgi:hypothetical protein
MPGTGEMSGLPHELMTLEGLDCQLRTGARLAAIYRLLTRLTRDAGAPSYEDLVSSGRP